MEHPATGRLSRAATLPSPETALAAIDGPVGDWFRTHFPGPTPVQRAAWPVVAAGGNCLLAAPTGGGKTFAAFLPILARLAAAPAPPIHCLYVAPLKALCNDALRTLRRVAREVQQSRPAAAAWRVAIRTGDTPASARRKVHTDPPDVLLTTPESLALLLTQPSARAALAGVRSVVVDEVHDLAAGKRGADLAVSLERLEELTGGPLQRVGLSATCRPFETAARFLVGGGRDCHIVQPDAAPGFSLRIEPTGWREGDGSWVPQRFFGELLRRLGPELEANRTTLVFANTRRLAERLVWALRRRFHAQADQIAVHHSSVARRRRSEVEKQLKEGLLKVVVSSTSLELGIDIGSVDGVVLVHPPGGVTRLLQRIGRSNHGPGRVPRGLVLVGSPAELLESAVTASAGQSGQIETIEVPRHPLDVLCQQLLGMASVALCCPDDAFALVRRAWPFRDLAREDFDACLDYLSGRDAAGREWLPPRLSWHGGLFTIADDVTLRALRQNVGTILGEDPASVRTADKSLIGEIDLAFAEKLQPGDRFLLDGRCLEYKKIVREAVVVEEVFGRPLLPRWLGDGRSLARDLAQKLFAFRTRAAEAMLHGPAMLAQLLREEYHLSPEAASLLLRYFQRQETVSQIPDAGTLLIEAVPSDAGVDYYFHTPLHRPANDAIARVVAVRLKRRGWKGIVPLAADLGFLVSLFTHDEVTPEAWRGLLAADGFPADLDGEVAASPAFRDRFRRVAFTGLMLLRNPVGPKQRVGGRDWAGRRLFPRLCARHPDFVLLRQARRELAEYCLDADAAFSYISDLKTRQIVSRWLQNPSPFAEGWTQGLTNPEELLGDPDEALERLHAQLMGKPPSG